MYMDVNSQAFRMSDVSLDSENQAIGFTMQQIYEKYKDSVSYPQGVVTYAKITYVDVPARPQNF